MVRPDVLDGLPDVSELKHRAQVLAIADVLAAFGGEMFAKDRNPFEYLRYRFIHRWEGTDDSVATFDSGTDDGFVIFFTSKGAYIKAFDHESEMNTCGQGTGPWPGLLETLPTWCTRYAIAPECQFGLNYTYRDGRTEPLMTVGLWRSPGDATWQHGEYAYGEVDGAFGDGASWLLAALTTNWSARALTTYLGDYWGSPIREMEPWERLMAGEPLTEELATSLSPNAHWGQVAQQAAIIGYPIDIRFAGH